MSEYIRRHNVTVLMYHFVFPAKYRRVVFDSHVDEVLKEACIEIEKRHQIKFIEVGTDRDHVYFLVQSVPTYPVAKLVTIIKSLTAREIFKQCPQVRKKLWGGEFWTDGYFASTVGKHGDENMIGKYVKNQGQEYKKFICIFTWPHPFAGRVRPCLPGRQAGGVCCATWPSPYSTRMCAAAR